MLRQQHCITTYTGVDGDDYQNTDNNMNIDTISFSLV